MTGPTPEIVQAAELLRGGQVAQAEAAVRSLLEQSPRNAPAVHLLGLVRNAAGDAANAERFVRASIEIEPERAEFRVTLAKLLARVRRFAEAEQAYRSALALEPNHRMANLGLARVLGDQGKHDASEAQCRAYLSNTPQDAEAWATLAGVMGDQFRLPEAEAAYRKAIAVGPQYAPAHHNLGAVLSQMERAEEALEALSHSESLGFRNALLHINRGRTLAQLYRLDEAENAFVTAIGLEPGNIDGQLMLAQLRHMRGDRGFARDIVAAAAASKGDWNLQMALADVLRKAGDLPGAEKLLRDVIAQAGPAPRLRSALAGTLHEAGRLKEAEIEALEAATGAPKDVSVIETLVKIQLSLGRHQEALPFIRVQRSRQPVHQGWIAYEAMAARLAGDPLYTELYDYDRLIRLYEVEAPPGWSSMKELNAALADALSSRHPFVAHSLDQSLRGGSQTARNLLSDPHPAIQAALQAFVQPIEHYCQSLDPSNNARHPMDSRKGRATILAGCWSVQLRQEGFHVNHIHPHGWISSAYYVAVPGEVEDATTMSGWLKFGEPRWPVPGGTPERVLQPKAGQLVLFPSYLWHGTSPIHGLVPRTTIAFDALPYG